MPTFSYYDWLEADYNKTQEARKKFLGLYAKLAALIEGQHISKDMLRAAAAFEESEATMEPLVVIRPPSIRSGS